MKKFFTAAELEEIKDAISIFKTENSEFTIEDVIAMVNPDIKNDLSKYSKYNHSINHIIHCDSELCNSGKKGKRYLWRKKTIIKKDEIPANKSSIINTNNINNNDIDMKNLSLTNLGESIFNYLINCNEKIHELEKNNSDLIEKMDENNRLGSEVVKALMEENTTLKQDLQRLSGRSLNIDLTKVMAIHSDPRG